MAKMFYSIEETAAKLGVSADQVKEMAAKGQLQEFRDRDKLMFKVEQVDMLAGPGSSDDEIKLADSGALEPLTLASSGSGPGIAATEGPKEQTGFAVLETDATEEGDPSAVTRVTTAAGDSAVGELALGGSAAGATVEEALGSRLGGRAGGTGAGMGGFGGGGGGGGLFETTTPVVEAPVGAMPAMAAFAEPYDGPGSGLVGGLAFGMIVALLLALAAVIFALTGISGGLLRTLGDQMWAVAGGAFVLVLVAAGIGWFLGNRG